MNGRPLLYRTLNDKVSVFFVGQRIPSSRLRVPPPPLPTSIILSLSLFPPLSSLPLCSIKDPSQKRGGGKRTATSSPFLSSPSLAAPLAFKRRARASFPLGLRLMRVTREEEEEGEDLTQIVEGEKKRQGKKTRLSSPSLPLPRLISLAAPAAAAAASRRARL